MTEQEKREKVIKGLECCNSLHNDSIVKCATDCPYWEFDAKCRGFVMRDALALLKAQEPVEPTEPDEDNMRYCGACGSPVGYEVLEAPGIEYVQYNYCPECGRAVKWDD